MTASGASRKTTLLSKFPTTLLRAVLCTVGFGFLLVAAYLASQTFYDETLQSIQSNHGETYGNPILAWMIPGNLSVVAGIVFMGVGWFMMRDKTSNSATTSLTSTIKSATVYRLVPVAVAPALLLLVVFLFLYQVLFLISCCLSWERIQNNQASLIGICVVLVSTLWYLIGVYRRYNAIGTEQLELEIPDGTGTESLKGELLIHRGVDKLPSPFTVELVCEERRNWPLLKDDSKFVNLCEEYWTVRGQTKTPVINPFESQCSFPFELTIPAWLPWPWAKETESGTVGIVWKINVSGSVNGIQLRSQFVLEKLNNHLAIPPNQRIRIAPPELSKVLFEQGVDWQLDPNQHTLSVAKVRLSRWQRMAILGVALVMFGIFLFDSCLQWTDGWLWFVAAILFLLCVACAVINEIQNKVLTAGDSIRVQRSILGFETERVLPKSSIGCVVVRRIEQAGDEDSSGITSLMFSVLLSPSDSDAKAIALATLRRRFIAKAFAHAIAHELGVTVLWE